MPRGSPYEKGGGRSEWPAFIPLHTRSQKKGMLRLIAGFKEPGRYRNRLFLAGVGEDFIHADDLTVQCAGDERLALDLTSESVRDGDAIDLQCAA